MIGYSFTRRVRHCLIAARHEAGRLGHDYVGTQHLLLGLLAVPDALPSHVADSLHIDRSALRTDVERRAGRGSATTEFTDIPYEADAKAVLERTMEEAARLDAADVDSEHLLLGMLAEDSGIAAAALRAQGVTLEDARQVIATAQPPVQLPPPSLLKRFSTWLSGDQRREPERGAAVHSSGYDTARSGATPPPGYDTATRDDRGSDRARSDERT